MFVEIHSLHPLPLAQDDGGGGGGGKGGDMNSGKVCSIVCQ